MTNHTAPDQGKRNEIPECTCDLAATGRRHTAECDARWDAAADSEAPDIGDEVAPAPTAYEIERAEQAAIFAQAEEHIAWARRNGHLR